MYNIFVYSSYNSWVNAKKWDFGEYMKKFLKILTIVSMFLLITILMVACSETKWNGSSVKDAGKVISNNGFVAETENNVYFINGIANREDNNEFGASVRGTLMGIKKTDVAEGKFENAEIVIPKLFVASDYNSGFAIIGDYVYYGTTNLDKNSSGKVANDELVFVKTKLECSNKKDTEILFNAGSLSTEYRICEVDGSVYVTFYDAKAKAIKVYSEATKTITTVAVTNEKDPNSVESLSAYKFLSGKDGIVAVYVNTVYAEKYYAEKAKEEGYTRTVAKYNTMYTVNAKGETVKVADGAENLLTYALTYTDGKYVFFTETDVNGTIKTFGVTASQIADKKEWKELDSAVTMSNKILVKDLSDAFSLDSDAKIVYKISLIKGENTKKDIFAKNVEGNSLICERNGSLYFFNTSNKIASVKANEEVKEVSRDTVTTAYYLPAFITAGEKEYVIYNDNSSIGASYTYITKIEDLTSNFIGKKIDQDVAKTASAYIDSISSASALEYTVKGDSYEFKAVEEKIANYKELVKDEKIAKLISEDVKKKVQNIESAMDLTKKYLALKDVRTFSSLSNEDKATLKANFEIAKTARTEILKNGKDTLSAVLSFVPNNPKYFYQEVLELISKDKI